MLQRIPFQTAASEMHMIPALITFLVQQAYLKHNKKMWRDAYIVMRSMKVKSTKARRLSRRRVCVRLRPPEVAC